jgi:hypothetical protein
MHENAGALRPSSAALSRSGTCRRRTPIAISTAAPGRHRSSVPRSSTDAESSVRMSLPVRVSSAE